MASHAKSQCSLRAAERYIAPSSSRRQREPQLTRPKSKVIFVVHTRIAFYGVPQNFSAWRSPRRGTCWRESRCVASAAARAGTERERNVACGSLSLGDFGERFVAGFETGHWRAEHFNESFSQPKRRTRQDPHSVLGSSEGTSSKSGQAFALHAADFLRADLVERPLILATIGKRSSICRALEHFSKRGKLMQ